MTAAEFKTWTWMLETEMVHLTRLMLEVNRKTNYAVFLWFHGHGCMAGFNIGLDKRDYNNKLVEMRLAVTVQPYWDEQDYIEAKLVIETAKRHLFECLSGTFVMPEEEAVDAIS